MCFVATRSFEPSTCLSIELKTPYLAETMHLEGVVLGANEKMKDTIYEIRIKFGVLSTEAKVLLEKLIKLFVDGDSHPNE